jgi:hypothetical protein
MRGQLVRKTLTGAFSFLAPLLQSSPHCLPQPSSAASCLIILLCLVLCPCSPFLLSCAISPHPTPFPDVRQEAAASFDFATDCRPVLLQ